MTTQIQTSLSIANQIQNLFQDVRNLGKKFKQSHSNAWYFTSAHPDIIDDTLEELEYFCNLYNIDFSEIEQV